MAASNDLIDFTVIESHKENIQALPSGRSAKALAQLYSPPLLGSNPSPSAINDANSAARVEFERELANIEDADDPLDVYDRYVKWTLDAYPSAQATPQSQLLPLLERATKAFQSSSHYKNDPRYLKIWLHYIRLFSDAPREAFVFLARQSVGESLALYYEEFAAWLEIAGRWNQAREVYQMGVDKQARPTERLMRKFGDFERRYEARPQDVAEPTSPALPAVRPALAVKLDPFASTSPSPGQQNNSSAGSKKSKGSKMAIFSDGDAPSRPSSGNSSQGWDNIGSLAERRKENSMEAKPWVGEKLKGGKTNGGVPKMMVFKDVSSYRTSIPRHLSSKTTSSTYHEDQCVLNPKTGRLECVFVNLDAVYPERGNLSVEYCFEELRAKHRGFLGRDRRKESAGPCQVPSQKAAIDRDSSRSEEFLGQDVSKDVMQVVRDDSWAKSKQSERGFEIFEDKPSTSQTNTTDRKEVIVGTVSKSLALNDSDVENRPPQGEEIDLAKKARREERANRTRKITVMDVKHIKNETKTIQLNMDSPTGPKIKRKKVAEPTMTINTKEAMDEIYDIFSQPLPSQIEPTDVDDSVESDDDEEDDDGYTTGDESTATGKISVPASEYGDETKNELLGGPRTAEDDATENTGWSDFTTDRDGPKEVPESEQNTGRDALGNSESTGLIHEDLMTPVDEEPPETGFVLEPPEDYEPPVVQMREMGVIPNHRLPFMTPIVEQTETSLGAETDRSRDGAFDTKTPSRRRGMPESMSDDDDEDDDELCSSPFQDVTADIGEEKRRILQPIRTKSTKGTLALGLGSAKSQLAIKESDADGPEATVETGPIIQDAQCNPMDPQIRELILSQMRPALSSFQGYHEHLDMSFGRSAEIKRYVRRTSKATNKTAVNGDKPVPCSMPPPVLELPGAGSTYTVKRELGAGTFAPVYLVENSSAMNADMVDGDDNNDGDDRAASGIRSATHRKQLEAVKMEEPPNPWEFYILQASHRRLGSTRAADSIVRAHEMHLFRDECFLIEEYRDQGTLLDLVNLARLENGGSGAGGMDEAVAMWFTVELLRTVEALHARQLIHGDLKADNVLVRFDDPGAETDWSPTYFPSGAHGWAAKGVCLIDFGRGIDMRHFVDHVGFLADWKTTDADCAEMRELRPWTYQIDYHGLAGIVHSLLFGKYMDTVADKAGPAAAALGHAGAGKTYRIRESLKRYWQMDLWADLFHTLLNPLAQVDAEPDQKMPLLNGMKTCRERMEAWLEENCERGVGLKGAIARMESAFRDRRRKSTKSGL